MIKTKVFLNYFLLLSGFLCYFTGSASSLELGNSFIENKGQILDTDGQVREDVLFYSNTHGAVVFLRKTGISFVTQLPSENDSLLNRHRLDLELLNINPNVVVEKHEPASTQRRFYYEHCPQGVGVVQSFQKVVYKDVYPHVDWVVYLVNEEGNTELKYDFIVSPGGEVNDIRLKYLGTNGVELSTSEAYDVSFEGGSLKEEGLYVYQKTGRIPAQFDISTQGIVSFNVNQFNRQAPLVIDPYIRWSTFFGGNASIDYPRRPRHDSNGNLWVIGNTNSTIFPTTVGAVQSGHGGQRDFFVAKFSPAHELLYCTFLGGPGEDVVYDLAIDSNDRPWFTGHAHSAGFPTTANAFQQGFNGGMDIILCQLETDGSLLYSTQMGGITEEETRAIAIDGNDDIWLTGFSWGGDFPISQDAAFPTFAGGNADAVLIKFSNAGQLLYSSYLGSDGRDEGDGIVCDTLGNVWVGGVLSGDGFPIMGNFIQDTIRGYKDAFLSKFTSDGTLIYSTLVGGIDDDAIIDLAINSKQEIWAVGYTRGDDFPCTPDAYDSVYHDYEDIFMMRVAPSGDLQYSTLFGGDNTDEATDMFINGDDRIWVVGKTIGPDALPIVGNAFQTAMIGSRNAFYMRFDSAGQVVYSSHLGGGWEEAHGICENDQNEVYLTGFTKKSCASPPGFPLFDPGGASYFTQTFGGSAEGFLIKFGETPVPGQGNDCYVCNQGVDFVLVDEEVCAGEMAQITDYSFGTGQYYWLANGTLVPAGPGPSFIPDEEGVYGIQLVGDNGFCLDTSATIDTVVANYAPFPYLGNDTIICEGESVSFGFNFASTSYLWSDGDTNASNTFDQVGEYWISVETDSGCSRADTMQLLFAESPIDLGEDTLICFEESISLDAGLEWENYVWLDGSTNQLLMVDTTGEYWVSGSDAFGCEWSDTLSLFVGELSVVLGPDLITLCNGDSITLAGPSDMESYEWQDGDTGTHYLVSGQGVFSLFVTDSTGCSGSDTIAVQASTPWVSLGSDTVLCGLDVFLLNAGDGFETYSWHDNTLIQHYIVEESGTFWVEVIDSLGCFASDTITLALSNDTIFVGQDTAVCFEESIELSPGPGFDEYLWSTGESTSSIQAGTSGLYGVTVTDDLNCEYMDEMTLQVYDPTMAFITQSNDTLYVNSAANYQWYWNGEVLSGATQSFLVPDSSGSYSVSVVDTNGCGAVSGTVDITITGRETMLPSSVLLYPNPVEERVSFEWNLAWEGQVTSSRLVNVLGQNLGSPIISSKVPGKIVFNLENISPGAYFLEVVFETGLKAKYPLIKR